MKRDEQIIFWLSLPSIIGLGLWIMAVCGLNMIGQGEKNSLFPLVLACWILGPIGAMIASGYASGKRKSFRAKLCLTASGVWSAFSCLAFLVALLFFPPSCTRHYDSTKGDERLREDLGRTGLHLSSEQVKVIHGFEYDHGSHGGCGDIFEASIPPKLVREFEDDLRSQIAMSERLVFTEGIELDSTPMGFGAFTMGAPVQDDCPWWKPWTLHHPKIFRVERHATASKDYPVAGLSIAVSEEDGLINLAHWRR